MPTTPTPEDSAQFFALVSEMRGRQRAFFDRKSTPVEKANAKVDAIALEHRVDGVLNRQAKGLPLFPPDPPSQGTFFETTKKPGAYGKGS